MRRVVVVHKTVARASGPIVPQDAVGCASCHRMTPDRQVQSLRHVIAWIAASSRSESTTVHPAPPGEMTLVRAAPNCENCTHEPPFRRDDQVQATVTPPLQRIITSFTMKSVETEAALLTHALQWLLPEVHLDAQSELHIGPAARHALIVANNLICAAQPGVDPPGVAGCDLATACEPSIDALNHTFRSENADDDAVSATDLVTIHWLHRGVQKIRSLALNYKPPEPKSLKAEPNMRRMLLWASGILALAFLIGGALAPSLLALLVGIIALGGLGYVWYKVPPPKPPPPPEPSGPQWPLNLRQAIEASQKSYDHVLAQLDRADLLGHADSLFDGTLVSDSNDVAAFLERIHASPCGPALVKWVAREAARTGTVPRLCEVGEDLLDQDVNEERRGGSENRGSEIACLLSSELTSACPDRGEKSPLWPVAAWQTENGEDDTCRGFGFPRLLGRLLRRAATLEQDQRKWSVREGRFIMRCRDLAATFLARSPLINPHWHLLQIRLLTDGLRVGRTAVRFPSSSDCSLTRMCARVEDSYRAYRRDTRVASGEQRGMDERALVEKEAWATMHMRGFLISPEFLLSPLEAARATIRRVVQRRHLPLLDQLLYRQLEPIVAAPGPQPVEPEVAHPTLRAAAKFFDATLKAAAQRRAEPPRKKPAGPRKQRTKRRH